jgi:hypothetical protein
MPQEKQTTAVQWLINELRKYKFIAESGAFTSPIIEDALQKERQQIEDAFNTKRSFELSSDPVKAFKTSEQYFDETFTQQQ